MAFAFCSGIVAVQLSCERLAMARPGNLKQLGDRGTYVTEAGSGAQVAARPAGPVGEQHAVLTRVVSAVPGGVVSVVTDDQQCVTGVGGSEDVRQPRIELPECPCVAG